MTFSLFSGIYSVLRFFPGTVWAVGCAGAADAAQAGEFFCQVSTPDEVSVVCRSGRVRGADREEGGWRVLGIEGPLDFSLVGVLAEVSGTLAAAGISIFAVSTFDTDYILVKERDLARAIEAVEAHGHRVHEAAEAAKEAARAAPGVDR